MQCNKLLNDSKSIPQIGFEKEHSNENSLIVKKIQSHSCSCPVYHGTFLMFSLINLVAVSAENSSSLHTYLF